MTVVRHQDRSQIFGDAFGAAEVRRGRVAQK